MKVRAWIHPKKGDDYQVELDFDMPADDATIHFNLKHLGCTVCTDYRII